MLHGATQSLGSKDGSHPVVLEPEVNYLYHISSLREVKPAPRATKTKLLSIFKKMLLVRK